MNLRQIARDIGIHLKRMEADPTINHRGGRQFPDTSYFMSGAWAAGRFVGVRYISYQGESHLSKAEAEEYLAWLNAGNNGTHRQMKQPLLESGQ